MADSLVKKAAMLSPYFSRLSSSALRARIDLTKMAFYVRNDIPF